MKYLLLLLPVFVSCTGTDPHSEVAHNRKVMALQEKFDRFDYNANGKLTRTEIEQGLRESSVEGVTPAEIDALMKHYDINDDGGISRWEAQHAINSPLPEHQ
ncbi:hypothetical protein HAHE_03910 [Haloferula helveola]|uniref:EF-hand domain-containing protein n=1 Tax=Haloferula helveola TaxID=490095 RepID=A0ABN6H0H4_9BACT|nr:hypothetical protein HAHE_03910 [Haloferula helveola]